MYTPYFYIFCSSIHYYFSHGKVQESVDKKSNEIKAIPDLLKILDIRGCYITIDAMGTQETIARRIVKDGGHYVLKVKKNQRILMKDICSYFDSNAASETIDFLIRKWRKTTDV